MQSGKEAVDLLVAKDMAGALEKSQNIDQYNEDRKELDKRITEEASRILEEHIDINRRKSIVIYNIISYRIPDFFHFLLHGLHRTYSVQTHLLKYS